MKMKRARIKVRLDNCTGCRLCEAVCSTVHDPDSTGDYSKSAIRILYDQFYREDKALVCLQCEKARCVASCPCGALFHESGTVKYNPDCCDGCKECIDACPFGAIWVVPETGKIVKCDLCVNLSGPQCVKACPANVITLYEERPKRSG